MIANIKSNRAVLFTSIIFTLFLGFSVAQVGMFGAATTSITKYSCSPLAHLILTLLTISQGALCLYCILGLISCICRKLYFIPVVLGSLVMLYKIALIIFLAIESMYVLGNCYFSDQLKDGIYSSFSMEIVLILVSMAMLGRVSVLNKNLVLSTFSVTRNYAIE